MGPRATRNSSKNTEGAETASKDAQSQHNAASDTKQASKEVSSTATSPKVALKRQHRTAASTNSDESSSKPSTPTGSVTSTVESPRKAKKTDAVVEGEQPETTVKQEPDFESTVKIEPIEVVKTEDPGHDIKVEDRDIKTEEDTKAGETPAEKKSRMNITRHQTFRYFTRLQSCSFLFRKPTNTEQNCVVVMVALWSPPTRIK